MDADRFSIKARRTTRIPLRIPVLVVFEENGKSRSLDGWTMIVNVHGAKIECKHHFELHAEVTIQVPFNGMSQKGKVVWSRSQPNDSGNHEFGVELDHPDNLWGVGFPPSDWDTTRGSKSEAATAAILDLAPAGVTRVRTPINETEAAPVAQIELIQQDQRGPASDDSTAPETPLQSLDMSIEGSDAGGDETTSTTTGRIVEFSEMEMTLQEEVSPMSNLQNGGVAEAGPYEPGQALWAEPVESNPTGFIPAEMSAPNPSPPAGAMSQINPTDKLFAFFNELVDSALQAKVLGLVEGVGRRIEKQVTEIESSALSRIEEQIQSTANRHSEALERHAVEYVGTQQQALEQNVRDYLAATEESARQRQREELDQNQRAMRESADALTQANAQRLEQHASDLVAATQQGLRASMEQQLPAIEKDLLERCRVVSDRMMAAQMEQWMLLFSDRVENARKEMEQRLDETMNEVFSRHSAALDTRLEVHLSQAGARLEQQLSRIGTQVRQTYLRHIVTELGRTQQVWIQQSQRQLEKMVLENLERSRRSLSQYMKSFGESLIQQATATQEAVGEPAGGSESQAELPLEQNLLEAVPQSSASGV